MALDSGVGLADVERFQRAAGGAPANVAVGLARLGTASAFAGQVGDDAFGQHLHDLLARTGVDVSALRLTPDYRTGLAFVSLGDEGEREFLFYRHPSADSQVQIDGLSALPALLARAAGFHFGGVLLASEPARSATWAALDLAEAANVPISFDPNLRLDLWASQEEARAVSLAALARARTVKLSREEAEFLTGEADVTAQFAALRQPDGGLLVITGGAAGAWHRTGGEIAYTPAPAVEAVDTTGAGDGFMAGLLHSLLGAQPATSPRQAVRFAAACGALTVTRRGAIPALPSRDEVVRLLAR